VTDASIVANLAHGVLFVVGSEMTSRRVAQRAVEQLELGQAKFLGAVLNRVDLEHNAYYYSRYYRPEYGGYYGSNGDAAPALHASWPISGERETLAREASSAVADAVPQRANAIRAKLDADLETGRQAMTDDESVMAAVAEKRAPGAIQKYG